MDQLVYLLFEHLFDSGLNRGLVVRILSVDVDVIVVFLFFEVFGLLCQHGIFVVDRTCSHK